MKHFRAIIVILVLVFFAVLTYIGMARSDLGTPPAGWVRALEWLGDNYRNDTVQESWIVAWWDYGYLIDYFSGHQAYINPGQNVDRVMLVAKNFISYEDTLPQWPLGTDYIILDYDTVNGYKNTIALWADEYYELVDFGRAFFTRLYYSESMLGYVCVYNESGIRIFEVVR